VTRFGIALACAAALQALLPAPALATPDRDLSLSAASVLLVSLDGQVFYAKHADETHAPASLVKLMTLYLALEDIERGYADWEDVVTISRRATMTPRYRMGLRAGEQVTFRVLLEGVGIASANDAATAVAEHLSGGSEDVFVDRMNAKAQEIGLLQTRFVNPHGLPDPLQRSTAWDVAILTARLLRDYPAARTILGGQTFIYRGRVYSRRIPLFNDPGGVEALKTGYTREAGYNLSVAVWRAGQQFLMVVLGAQTRSLSFLDGKKLLRYAFAQAGLADEDAVTRVAAPRVTRVRKASSAGRAQNSGTEPGAEDAARVRQAPGAGRGR
jgi:D-alanyl-D-alanine carboxypeptidase